MNRLILRVLGLLGLHECLAWQCREEKTSGAIVARCLECGRVWRWSR